MIFLSVLALVTRLYWNLFVHPPRNYVYSDMSGYFHRALDVAQQPFDKTYDYLAFYPWGTHAYLGLVDLIFSTPKTCPRTVKDSIAAPGCAPMDIAMALTGAVGVIYTILIARRLLTNTREHTLTGKRRWVWVVIGLAAIFYYPFLSQSGYYLSESPFFACLAASTFYGLRLVDRGKTKDALLMGLFVGLGAWVRPQILMSVLLLGIYWLFRRRQLPGASLRRLAIACVPMVLFLVISAVRTTRHARAFDKNEFALVSTNDALNYAFGRCHPIGIEARLRNYRAAFGPPSLGSLYHGERELTRKKLPVFLRLLPALPNDPNCDVNKRHRKAKKPTEPCVLIHGTMWSRDILRKLGQKCIEKTGPWRQAYYGMTHVVLNFGFNYTWPDAGQRLRKTRVLGLFDLPYGGPIMKGFQVGFGATLMPLGLLGCILAFRKRRAREALLAIHIVAASVVAWMYFGETRLRTPYDFVFLILGFDLLSRLARRAGRKILAWTAR